MSELYCKLIEDLKSLSKVYNLTVNVNFETCERTFSSNNFIIFNMPNECELIIEDIPNDINELQLIPLIGNYGDIYEFRLMLNNDVLSHNNVGYCTLKSSIAAENCAIALNNYVIKRDNKIKVRKMIGNCTLHVDNICPDKTKEEISYALIKAGMLGMKDIVMFNRYDNPSKNRGFVLVQFHTHEFANLATTMFSKSLLVLFNKNVTVNWATYTRNTNGDHHFQHKDKLFLLRLNESQSNNSFSNEMKDVLGTCSIRRIYKNKEFAFIQFQTKDKAIIGKVLLEDYYADTGVNVTLGVPSELYEKFGTYTKCTYDNPSFIQKLRLRFEDFWLRTNVNVIHYGKPTMAQRGNVRCDCLLPHHDDFNVYLRMIVTTPRVKCNCPRTKEILNKILYSLDMDFF